MTGTLCREAQAAAITAVATVPVASAIMGSVAGWPAGLALMSHFTVMVKEQSQIFPSGPPVVERAIGALAAGGDTTLGLAVTFGNPAERVYRRLGFRHISSHRKLALPD